MSPDAAIRVLIVADHALTREGIASLLAGRDDITVAGTADGPLEALERFGDLEADVLLMELPLPEVDGGTATTVLHQRYPGLLIVVLTRSGDDDSVRAAIQAGANACLLNTVGIDELAEVIRGVIHGRSTFSSEFLPLLLEQPDEAGPGASLTARQRELLPLLANGLTNKAIAEELGLTEGTVRIYVSAILAKLGVANRTEASVVAIRDELIKPRSPEPGPSSRRTGR